MAIRSLGYRTDLLFPAFDGEILDRGSYRVIRTPSNPTYHWGNFLLFDAPPSPGDYERWTARFASEIGVPPAVKHVSLGWDVPTDASGEVGPFIAAGFKLLQLAVLTRSEVRTPPSRGPGEGRQNWAGDIELRPLTTPADWAAAVENHVICREEGYAEADYRTFSLRAMERYRRMVEAGLGAWYAAFLGDRVVADLGVFCTGDLGRYQSVQTHPDHRRRGIAGALVNHAATHACRTFGLKTLVIVSKADSAAQRLYQSLGFEQTEHQWGLERAPRDPAD